MFAHSPRNPSCSRRSRHKRQRPVQVKPSRRIALHCKADVCLSSYGRNLVVSRVCHATLTWAKSNLASGTEVCETARYADAATPPVLILASLLQICVTDTGSSHGTFVTRDGGPAVKITNEPFAVSSASTGSIIHSR